MKGYMNIYDKYIVQILFLIKYLFSKYYTVYNINIKNNFFKFRFNRYNF